MKLRDLSDEEFQEHVRERFDSFAEEYAAAEDTESCRSFSREILQVLGNVKGKHILDAGCGFGQQAEILLKGGASVIGVDISGKLISMAQKRNARHKMGTFVASGIVKYLAKTHDRFDFVVSFFELMFHRAVAEVIRGFHSVLKPTGHLLILVPHPTRNMGMHNPPDYFAHGLANETWAIGPILKYHHLLSHYTDSLIEANFQIIRILEPEPPVDKVALYDIDIAFPKETHYPQALVMLCQKIDPKRGI